MEEITIYLITNFKYTQDAIKRITVNPNQKISILDSYISNANNEKYMFKRNILINNSTFLDYQIKDDDLIFLLTKEQISNQKLIRRIKESTNTERFFNKIRIFSNHKLMREYSRISDLKRMRYETKQLVYSSSLFLQREIKRPNDKFDKRESDKTINLNLETEWETLDEPANQPLPICF